METHLDHTYLRPGIISRAAAVGLAAVGIGAGVLLACWGLSFFFHYDDPVVKKLEALGTQLEALTQRQTDQLVEVIGQRLDVIGQNSTRETEALNQNLVQRLEAINKRIEVALAAKQQPNFGEGTTPDGAIIRRQVTVFSDVVHHGGKVVTGWSYKDGASNGPPFNQYCYWLIHNSDGEDTKVDIAENGQRRQTSAMMSVPALNEAQSKCQWWSGS
jgi:hypothetical protein